MMLIATFYFTPLPFTKYKFGLNTNIYKVQKVKYSQYTRARTDTHTHAVSSNGMAVTIHRFFSKNTVYKNIQAQNS